MKKKLLAVAVAGAFAVPTIALADGVTISGYFKQSIENLDISNEASVSGPAGHHRANSNQWQIADGGSRIDFDVSEDLGGGLKAIAEWDQRVAPQNGSLAQGSANGNAWVGFDNIESWGRVTVGRRDLHYYHTAVGPAPGQALEDWSTALLSYAEVKTGTNAAPAPVNVGVGTRRANSVIEYTSPKWGLFTFSAAYGMDPYNTSNGSIGNINNTIPGCAPGATVGTLYASGCQVSDQKGYELDFTPQLRGANWVAGFNYFYEKGQGATTTFGVQATPPTEKSYRAWGFYDFPQGIKVGLNYDQSKIETAVGDQEIAKRHVYGIPVAYTTGPWMFGAEYTKAQEDDHLSNSGANMATIYAQYSLSKRTQVGVSYARLNNDSNASYNLFVGGAPYYTTGSEATQPGEDPRLFSFTVNHSF
jgi:predicted porin